ncbi:MAG: protein translocase subunit SecD [Anaerolineaceae bacterium]|nr:protein translocase subunit SecD [Anaerolineaceae bacterium]
MNRRYINLIIILILFAAAIWVDLPNNSGIHIGSFNRSLDTVLGLDLQGGMQVLLEVDDTKLPAGAVITPEQLEDAKQILENRSNGLGVSEVIFQVAGNRRILGEFPGLTDTQEVVDVLKETGQLEFVDMGSTPVQAGLVIKTTMSSQPNQTDQIAPTATLPAVETPVATEDASPSPVPTEEKVWTTIMTGTDLKNVSVTANTLGSPVVAFELTAQGQRIFADYTTNNVGKYLGIVLDKKVISTPVINTPITEGSGIIEGKFTVEEANGLAIQLRYGSLPVPLKVVESRIIGPTLGQDSLQKSMVAGLIGFAIVTLFMIIYYRLPGFVAILAIVTYALLTLAIFKLIPVTLTLAGIAGFLLSTGGALDANILIFERLKEELRNGRTLFQAVDLGWKRAWPSIRDSNIATIITSVILFWFGSTFGATIVKGFAVTLALGVIVSLFSAVFITRTLLNVVVDLINPADHRKWFGG